jgi:hypothetical protein
MRQLYSVIGHVAMGATVTAAAVATGLAVTTGQAAAAGGVAVAGRVLHAGNSVVAPNGMYSLEMQSNGDLVEYARGHVAVWSTGTAGEPGNYAIMQTDGNFVIYGSAGQVRWNTQTWGYGGSHLAVQGDGNVALYSPAGQTLWARSWTQSVPGEQLYAQVLFAHYGWDVAAQFPYLNDLWGTAESGWRWNVCNGGNTYPDCNFSGAAYGIPQSDPGAKMVADNPDWATDGLTQVAWGLNYIEAAYGTPEQAWHQETSGCANPYCGYIGRS